MKMSRKFPTVQWWIPRGSVLVYFITQWEICDSFSFPYCNFWSNLVKIYPKTGIQDIQTDSPFVVNPSIFFSFQIYWVYIQQTKGIVSVCGGSTAQYSVWWIRGERKEYFQIRDGNGKFILFPMETGREMGYQLQGYLSIQKL